VFFDNNYLNPTAMPIVNSDLLVGIFALYGFLNSVDKFRLRIKQSLVANYIICFLNKIIMGRKK